MLQTYQTNQIYKPFDGANAIGDAPTNILNNGDPSVIHGETVVAP